MYLNKCKEKKQMYYRRKKNVNKEEPKMYLKKKQKCT